MEQKIEKLFSFFRKMKNEPFYTSIIHQIIQIYENCPESLKFIIYNLNQLIFTSTKEVKLRMRHRQICASIVSKLNKIYVQRITNMVKNGENIDLENFQLQSEETDNSQNISQQKKQERWEDLDMIKLIENSELLLCTQKDPLEIKEETSNEGKIFDEYINMKQATMINIEELFKDVKSDRLNMQVAIQANKSKYKNKIEKIKRKKQEYSENIKLTISNPFNLLYQICIDNFLNPEWQLRHLSVLILKELLIFPQFLGFHAQLELSQQNAVSNEKFIYLESQTKQFLSKHLENIEKKETMFNKIIQLCLKVLCLDRFADFQSDQSNIIVRGKAAETLTKCYVALPSCQLILLKKLKVLFDKEAHLNSNSNFTWEVKHSFLAFLNFLTQYPQHQSNIYKLLHQSFIKMLINDQQIDEIVLCICKCFKKFIGQKFFGEKEIRKVNEQVWRIVKYLDDISISTISVLQLLGSLFPFFNLNVITSLGQIRKFFTSKIPEVRKQFYNLMSLLYEKTFASKNQNEKKIIESNIIQFLQACIVEYDKDIFETLKNLSPFIFDHIRKQKKMHRVTTFITDVVLHEQYTETIIEKKFQVFQTFGLAKNDYIYIYELQKSHVNVDKYIDKRIWKVAEVVAKGFEKSFENFSDLISGIQRNTKQSYRAKLFIAHLMARLIPFHGKQKLFEDYQKKVLVLMKLQFTQVEDMTIQNLKNHLNNLLEVLKKNQTMKKALTVVPTDMKTAKNIVTLYNFFEEERRSKQKYDEELLNKIYESAITVENIIENSKTLFRQIKVLSTYYYVKKVGFSNDIVNSIVAAIKESFEEDRYRFISEYGAYALHELTSHISGKKAIFTKIINNILQHVSKKYENKRIKITENQSGYNLKGQYMGGLRTYILKVRQTMPEWIQIFKDNFIQDFDIHEEERNSTLYLLNGSIDSLLSICKLQFFKDLLKKIDSVVNTKSKVNKQLVYGIIQKCFVHLIKNYDELQDISNEYFKWFLMHLEKGDMIFLQCLNNLSQESIFTISGVCSLFILEIVRDLSNNETKNLCMMCLSNIVVGIYMNNQKIPFSQELRIKSEEGIQFVKNFKDSSNFNYDIKVSLKEQIQLREYQLQGIQWLGFLTKFNLNGALCDDMGLGKTLQIFTLMENQYLKDIQQGKNILPSLIIVPTTLTQHWAFQYEKYFEKTLCNVEIVFKQTENLKLTGKKPKLFITNYQTMEKRIDLFEKQNYKFIVLDEGHIIKNPKTLKFQAVKKLKGTHRFILTGTPIQNRLKQLWSLFDFLMPGYLYSKEVFNKNYEKLFEVNLTTFKEDELLFTEQQKKILQKLHFKVMPFIMRRMKSQVLRELPEKIINDYYCELSPLQVQLYSKFESDNEIKKGNDEKNILASLTKMRKILNHPNLVQEKGTYQDSGKFIALNELFQQLGFRQEQSSIQNKAIIFSRSTSTIELLQSLFMKELYPNLKYSKLTSSVKVNERFLVAQTFNGDNDIKVLLVTTHVGGEGLNLSSANTVIMFDHDYNPTIDMQAIDRAHRIGQKRVLNVYRMITKNTLEERIMGIQKFKKNLAQAIVNIDNASIKNIETSRLPELLQNMKDLEENKEKKEKVQKSFYSKLVQEMQENAIGEKDYDKEY